MTDRPAFVVTLRAEPGVADPVAELRALLKRALRVHGLKCVLCVQEPDREDAR